MHALSVGVKSENATKVDPPAQTVFDCVYTEDITQTHFADDPWHGKSPLEKLKSPTLSFADSSLSVDPSNHETLQKSTVDMVIRIFGSLDDILAASSEFFTGTHQRISAISKLRFDKNLQALTTGPRADFAALCLSIFLIQQMPLGKKTNMQSPLYFNVKNLIGLLEAANGLSLDLLHCRILVTFYEMGHALHTAAYMSVSACARAARALGLHRKRWRNLDAESDKLILEEEKRAWWAVVIMDRFINLCNGDALFVTDDPERTDPLPISDLIWSESSVSMDLEGSISAPPSLDTPFSITVGQMARECQISHLAGRVARHVFDPIPDPDFNSEEAFQLERTMKAYLPLLANEELKIGKYCGAYGMCNSALFILYEFMLSRNTENAFDRHEILQSIEDTSIRALTFAEASYGDREENYPLEVLSPYLSYSLCQAAIVQHRLWKQTSSPTCKERLDMLKTILGEFTKRWTVAWQYLEIIENLHDSWPSILNIKGNYVLARAFLPCKKAGGTIIAYSSGFAFLPPTLPFLSKSSAYSVCKMGTARFYEFLAVEHPDLNVFVLQPGIVRTALYEKGELELDATLDTVQLPAHFTVWLASTEAIPFSGRFLFSNWDVEK
ncbi:hypothetical protein EG329_013321 [Mollisiaceae sp. DMI_Dod_QoI]|nr:hypothetical protein EG329_013321 [Helotiales sp. DMI_Dod_QoI]